MLGFPIQKSFSSPVPRETAKLGQSLSDFRYGGHSQLTVAASLLFDWAGSPIYA